MRLTWLGCDYAWKKEMRHTCCWPCSFGLSRILVSLSSSDMTGNFGVVVDGCAATFRFFGLELF